MLYLLQIDTSTAFSYGAKIRDMAFDYAPKVLGSILIYLIGSWLINLLLKGLKKMFASRKYDASLQTFLLSLIKISLLILLFLAIVGQLGVNTTSFAALLAGAGLAIGAALNGSLGNLAGGVMLLLFKPFKVGDYIEAQGMAGVVKEMGIFNTTILSAENKTIFLPNGGLSTGVITNCTSAGFLRVDLQMAIAPDQSIEKARKVAIETMLQHPKVLKSPEPEVNVNRVGDGMVTLAIRPYTAQPDYWEVYFAVQELVKNAFDANNIAGPTPTRIIINKQ